LRAIWASIGHDLVENLFASGLPQRITLQPCPDRPC
jgi:hypothetical protein